MQHASFNTPEIPDSSRLLFAQIPDALREVFLARYSNLRQIALGMLTPSEAIDLRVAAIVLLEGWVDNPVWSGYLLPEKSMVHSAIVRARVLRELRDLPADPTQIADYFFRRDRWLKYVFNIWLLANPGQALEIYKIDAQAAPTLLRWLKDRFNLVPGDAVLHRHALGGRDRAALHELGLPVPYEFLAETYYADSMEQAAELTMTNQYCRGIVGEGSWIYNPANFVPDGQGRTPVRFTFLGDDHYTGERHHVPREELPGYEIQKSFALGNSAHRRQMNEEGAYEVEVYGVFMPAVTLIERFHPIYKDLTT